jgi:hypothetical protein
MSVRSVFTSGIRGLVGAMRVGECVDMGVGVGVSAEAAAGICVDVEIEGVAGLLQSVSNSISPVVLRNSFFLVLIVSSPIPICTPFQ